MDVYLVDPTTNLLVYCIVVDSLELAQKYYPQWLCYERTASNAYLNLTPEPLITEVANDEPVTGYLGDEYHD